MRTFLLLVALLPALAAAQDAATPAPAPAAAPAAKKPATRSSEVYKWVDDKGVVHYTDKPPSQNATPATLPPLQTYKGGTSPNLSRFERGTGKAPAGGGAAPAAGSAQLQIVTPSSGETFAGGQRVVPVAVMVTPALEPGQQLIFLLDGVPQATPTTNTSMDFVGVDRGSHSVSVTLVDANGQQLGQSSPVSFNVQQPIAGRAQEIHDQTSKPPKKKK